MRQNYIYFDTASTALKPQAVLNIVKESNMYYPINIHNLDNLNSWKLFKQINEIRSKVAFFINAENPNEIIFNSGCTEGLNQISTAFLQKITAKHNIVITKIEHSSNMLPWFKLKEITNCEIRFAPLNQDYEVDIQRLGEVIDKNTFLFSTFSVSNILGSENDIPQIVNRIKKFNANVIIVCDATQSAAGQKIDVGKWNIDFLTFSAHKMMGPFGLGIMWAQRKWLLTLNPLYLGGGSTLKLNLRNQTYENNTLPNKWEAGTKNNALVKGLAVAIDYIYRINYYKIQKHRKKLVTCFLTNISSTLRSNLIIYSSNYDHGIICFALKNINSHDLAYFLGTHYKIIVRAGDMCCKGIKEVLHVNNVVRISFYIYNTVREVKKLMTILNNYKVIFKQLLDE